MVGKTRPYNSRSSIIGFLRLISNPLIIGIIHLSILGLCVLCVLCGKIIPIQR